MSHLKSRFGSERTVTSEHSKNFYLTIARHGQTEGNSLKLIQGKHFDTPLSELGRKQAIALGQYFAKTGKKFNRVYCSDLGRAQETCRLILDGVCNRDGPPSDDNNNHNQANDHNFVADTRLGERNYGIFEGHPINELLERAYELGYDDENFTQFVPEGGESMEEVAKRVIGFFIEALCRNCKPDEQILVVSHWGTIKEMLKFIRSLVVPMDSSTDELLVEAPNTSFSEFRISCEPDKLEAEVKKSTSQGLLPTQGNLDYREALSIAVQSLHQLPHLEGDMKTVNLRGRMD